MKLITTFPGAAPESHPRALYANGDEEEVMGVTLREVKLEDEVRSRAGNLGSLWSSSYKTKRLCIQRRADRHPLLLLLMEKEGAMRQICQMPLRLFGDPELEELVLRSVQSPLSEIFNILVFDHFPRKYQRDVAPPSNVHKIWVVV